MQKILTEDVPMAWLVEVELPTLLDKRYQDVVVSAIGVNPGADGILAALESLQREPAGAAEAR